MQKNTPIAAPIDVAKISSGETDRLPRDVIEIVAVNPFNSV